jgi:hypothetical protein
LLGAGTLVDLDSFGTEAIIAATGEAGRFGKGDDHPPNPGGKNGVCTRRGFPVMRAGLEGHIERATSRPLSGIGQCHDLGMVPTEGCVIALACELPLWIDDEGSHHRVRRGAATPASGQLEGEIHPAVVWVIDL